MGPGGKKEGEVCRWAGRGWGDLQQRSASRRKAADQAGDGGEGGNARQGIAVAQLRHHQRQHALFQQPLQQVAVRFCEG